MWRSPADWTEKAAGRPPVAKGRALLFGLCLGFILAWAPGIFLVLTLALLACAWIRRFASEEDRRFLYGVFLVSLGIRGLAAVLNQWFLVETVRVPLLGPDGERYSAGAWYISRLVSGLQFERLFSAEFHHLYPNSIQYFDYADFVFRFQGRHLPPLGYHATGLFTYGIAVLYSLLGYAPVALKWLNGFQGGLLPLLAFGLGKRLFGSRTAGRISAVLLALHPFLLVWSITALKDPLLILAAMFFLYAVMRCLSGEWVWLWGVLAGGVGATLFGTWTGPLFGITLGVGMLGWAVARFWRTTRWMVGGTAILLIAGWVYAGPWAGGLSADWAMRWKDRYAERYEDPQPSRYRIFPDSVYGEGHRGKLVKRPFTPGEFFYGVVLGIAHFLFLPYPCCANGWHQTLASVLMLFWYALLPFAVLGYLHGWRKNAGAAWFLGIFAAGVSFIIALNSVVVWTMTRHRDLVSPLFLIWAGGGLGWAWSKVARSGKGTEQGRFHGERGESS